MSLLDININWTEVVYNLTRLMFAYVLALPIAWNREREVRSAGLRTFPLVAVASCGFMLQGMSALDSTDAESRVMYGILTGIGFIGGGAILKDSGNVTGTAMVAGIWNKYRRYRHRCRLTGSGMNCPPALAGQLPYFPYWLLNQRKYRA